MIVATVKTFDGVKLYLDHKNRITTDSPRTLLIAENRRAFERLAFFTVAQIQDMARRVKA